jgi:general secretion pathway protein D
MSRRILLAPPGTPLRSRPLALALGLCLALLGACASSPIVQSHDLWAQGRVDEAVLLLQEASAKDPGDRPLKAAYVRQRDQALGQIYVAAEGALATRRLDEAQGLFERALRLDADAARARDGLEHVASARRLEAQLAEATRWSQQGRTAEAEEQLRRILAVDPNLRAARRLLQALRERQRDAGSVPAALQTALKTPVSVEFRETPLRSVFEVLSRAAGLNFVFDRDVKTDTKITIFIRDNPIEDVLKVLLSTNALDRKILNGNTLLIFPSTAAKNKEYQELVVRTFYLVNVEAKQAEAVLKTLVHVKDVYIDEKINTIVVRDTADAVRLAERVVQSIDIPDAEVMLELEVIELSHTRALNLGIQLPTSITRGSSSPIGASSASSGSGTAASSGSIPTSNFSSLITTIPNPLLLANLSLTDNDTNLLANPRIRVRNREKAKILIGEKLPVITSTAVQNAGVASSVSYIDVGLKLEVEPQVYLDDEVGIKVQLEVNSNLGQITLGSSTTGQTTAYNIGTRTAQTALRLRDGETQVLAGLINDNESDSWNKVPGLSDLPVIGRLFSNDNSSHEKSEIVLLITPRIVRNLGTPDGEPLAVPAGTENAVGAPPLSLGPTAPQSMALRGGDAGARGGARAPTEPAEAPVAEDASSAAPATPQPAAAAAARVAPTVPVLPPAVRGLDEAPQAPLPAAPGSNPFPAEGGGK